MRQGTTGPLVAREYGFPGGQELRKEVELRSRGIEWAVGAARRLVHDNDVGGLRRLLAEYPALLSWKADENDGGLLGMATGSYGDSFDAMNHFPLNNAHYCSDYVNWFGEKPGPQRVLDTALAWAVLNDQFEVADFLLAHGAEIELSWWAL